MGKTDGNLPLGRRGRIRERIIMPQDAFTLRYICKELGELFVGGKISKINQPSKDLLSLLIYTHKGTVKLDVDLSAKYCRVSAGENTETPNPKVAPNFCMLLRKHLQNAEITAVSQLGFERVLCFDFKCFSEFEITEMRLYLEIMGKYSNAILVKDGTILGALKTASLETGARRVTLSGAKYLPPEKQDKADPADLDGLKAAVALKRGDGAKFIADNVAGVAYVTAVDIIEKYGEDFTAEQIYSYLNDQSYSPCVVYRDGQPVDFRARLTDGAKETESLLAAQAEFYTRAVTDKRFADRKRKLVSALSSAEKKVEKQLAQTREKLEECEKADGIKLKGELITANIYAVQRGESSFEAINYYDPDGGKISIELDPRLTPSQNAQKYFRTYAKLKRTAQNLCERKAQSEGRLNYLMSISESLNAAEETSDLIEIEEELTALYLLPAQTAEKGRRGKNLKSETPYRKYVYEGATVLCGRNNVQNDRLTRSLSPTDLWLHAKTFHSSHVAVVCGAETPAESVIKFAAEICAYYSEARERDKVPVDYTLKKFVKKPNGANAGFAVYTDFKTILVAPDAHKENRTDE